jgi:23S rRNA (cytidine1920-2'-O)/16S rRNA (cytidine1409-2'-O)-methyltransferase
VGASSGGFTQILLEENVSKVYAVDVGSFQLDERLKDNQKVVSIENCDIRNYNCNEHIDLVVCDVSFISVLYIFEKILSITSRYLIVLFKPQFEVGKEAKRDKKGVVKDNFAIDKSMKNFETFAISYGCKILATQKSQIKGKNGNEEYFYFFEK